MMHQKPLTPPVAEQPLLHAIFSLVFVETFPMVLLDSKLRKPESVVFCVRWLKQ